MFARNNDEMAWVCERSLAGIVGSNPAGSMNVYCGVACVVRWRSLRRANYLSRGVLPCVNCLSVVTEQH